MAVLQNQHLGCWRNASHLPFLSTLAYNLMCSCDST